MAAIMDPDAFNAFCAALPAVSHVVQWGGADVWKVGGRAGEGDKLHAKVFAIGAWHHGAHAGITFKVSDIGFEMLRDRPGLRPAPYLASRGMKWIQHYAAPGLGDADLREHLARSHRLVAAGLPKKVQRALGLTPAA